MYCAVSIVQCAVCNRQCAVGRAVSCAERNPLDMVQGTESIAQSAMDSEYQVESTPSWKTTRGSPIGYRPFP